MDGDTVAKLLFTSGSTDEPNIARNTATSFRKLTRQAHRSGQLETLPGVGLVSNHLIGFAREALRGHQNASFYSARRLDA